MLFYKVFALKIMTTKLRIGDQISQCDTDDKWRTVVVNDIKDNKFNIQLRHPDPDVGETISPFWVEDMDKLNKNIIVKHEDRKPLNITDCGPIYPAYYFDNASDKHYIVIAPDAITNFDDIDRGIIMYDIVENKCDPIPYPENFQPSCSN